ncbi:MAG TPA: 4Fe-4S dicluster domain-containing protein, partial [Geomonas sp.]
IPPKKYLLPFREEILQLRDGIYHAAAPPGRDIVLFGVHPCDLEGIAYLDRVFLGDRPDPCYAARRARLTLVGISCEPDDFCFCSAPPEAAPCDLYLSALDDGFLTRPSTPKGEAIARAAHDLLTEAAPASAGPCRTACRIRPQDPQLRFSDNPLWDRFAQLCLACGACSVCCPTCYCFDVREYLGLAGDGARLREWDNCLFKMHGEVAGANFRTSRLERLRYRFLHKYCGFSPLEGVVSCVGCGRCKEACPVDIDLRELIETAPPEGDPT